MKVKDIIEMTSGKLLSGDEEATIKGYTQDTRNIKEGYLYIPLVGKRDGHDFIDQAFAKGAIATLAERPITDQEHTVIQVTDTLKAMGDIARGIRQRSKALVIGVTGSVGKTSTKDLIASVVATKYSTLKTQGNYNNNIGVPLTIFNYHNEEAMVIEMGMNHLGEIDYLTKITLPDIAVITNVGTAHIGQVGSRENILKAKMEITHGLKQGGTLIINGDNDMLQRVKENEAYHLYRVGIDNDKADLRAYALDLTSAGSRFKIRYNGQEETFTINVPGKHFIYNALSAIAVGLLCDIPLAEIKAGVAHFELTKNRSDVITMKDHIRVIDGTYNANLDSMNASIDVLAEYDGRKIAVLADMLELGEYSEKLHREVGRHLIKDKIDIVLTVGEQARYISDETAKAGLDTRHFEDNNALEAYLEKILRRDDVLLIKGSNAMHLRSIIEKLKELR